MRRTVFFSLGVLEAGIALILAVFAWQLPGAEQVEDAVGRVERVSRKASDQVGHLRGQVRLVRERQPQLRELSDQLRSQLRLVGDGVRQQQVDYTGVKNVRNSLGDVAKGLDGLAETMDPKGIGQMGASLKTTADFLDLKLAPGAEQAAARLEKVSELVKTDAQRLNTLLKEAPLDLGPVKAVSTSLGKFDEGLTRMTRAIKGENFKSILDGFKGMETALSGGAAQVDRMAALTYPTVDVQGLRVNVEQRPLWPEGKATAEGMRKAAAGVRTLNKELQGLQKDLPGLRDSLDSSRKVVNATRMALDHSLRNQEKLAPLLKSIPQHAARLAEELPQVSSDLAKILRETAKLKEMAGMLRQTQKSMDVAVARWPELRGNLAQSAVLIRATQKQMADALKHRKEYEASARQTIILTETFASLLPFLTKQVEEHLLQEEQSLNDLGDSLDEVADVLPACSHSATRLLRTTQLLLLVVAAVAGLHGIYLVLGARLGPTYSP
jgi:uncharacterized phage infection (PIP) family protein YhgE